MFTVTVNMTDMMTSGMMPVWYTSGLVYGSSVGVIIQTVEVNPFFF